MNVILLAIAAVIKFAHVMIQDNRLSWYVLVFEQETIILIFALVLWRIIKFYNGRLKQYGKHLDLEKMAKLAKYNFVFWFISFMMHSIDNILLYNKINIQSEIIILKGMLFGLVTAKIIIILRSSKYGKCLTGKS